MLKKIYIDNFSCLVNFELPLDSINLFLGPNGAGKSTIFEVLKKIQAFIGGDKVEQLFTPDSLTRWQHLPTQKFELELEGNTGIYKYELAIEHDTNRQRARVLHEKLWFNHNPLLNFAQGEAQLYRDNHSVGPVYPFDWSQSAVAALPERNDNTRLTWFRKRLSRFLIVKLDPMQMLSVSAKQDKHLSPLANNFSSWYRYISQNQGKAFEITEALKEVIDGFGYFNFAEFGEQHRDLKVYFSLKNGNYGPVEYRFDELSDGQRTLIALYAMLHFARSQDYTVCIDEPENFVALPEIQPWLTLLYDFCLQDELQALLISHHPELINYLAASAGYWFDRQNNGPVRVQRVAAAPDEGLAISELVARGWLNE